MFWKLSKINLLAIVVALLATSGAVAAEKKLEIDFDKSSICCIMNRDILAEKLEQVEGINTAAFTISSRRVYIYHDPELIGVAKIVESIAKITHLDKNQILPRINK